MARSNLPSLSPDPVMTLPSELMLHILLHLDVESLLTASRVTRAWHYLCMDSHLWRQICRKADVTCNGYPGNQPNAACCQPMCKNIEGTIDWRHLYKEHVRVERNWRHGRFVSFQLPQPDFLFEGHTHAVYNLQIRGSYLVSGGADKTVRIWSLQTQRLIGRPLVGHKGEVLSVQFNPRGSEDIIVSGSTTGELIAWRFSSQRTIRSIPGAHAGALTSIRFDTFFVVTSSADQTIKIWDYRTLCGRHDIQRDTPTHALKTLRGHEGGVSSVDFSGDNLVSVSVDNTIRLWSISQGVCLKVVEEPRSIVCLRFDGEIVVCGGRHQTLSLYDIHLNPIGTRLKGHTGIVRAVQCRFGKASTGVMVSASHDGYVILWTKAEGGEWRKRPLRISGATRSQKQVDAANERVTARSRVPYQRATSSSHRAFCGGRPALNNGSQACEARIAAHVTNTLSLPTANATQELYRADEQIPGPLGQNMLQYNSVDTKLPMVFGVDCDRQRIACCSEYPTIYGWDFANEDSHISPYPR